MRSNEPLEPLHGMRPGDEVLRRRTRPRPRLRIPPYPRIIRFFRVIVTQTPFLKMISLLTVLWLVFCAILFFMERGMEGAAITSYGRALYWGIAAFSTAGIADTPLGGASQIVGGIWIVVGSIVFFGTIVATVTVYFTRPLQRPSQRIIDTIQYNLEQLHDLSLEELDLLKVTTDSLIGHIERLKLAETPQDGPESAKGGT